MRRCGLRGDEVTYPTRGRLRWSSSGDCWLVKLRGKNTKGGAKKTRDAWVPDDVADTRVFVRCSGPDDKTFQRLWRAGRQADVSSVVPGRVYEEFGGNPAADKYSSGDVPYPVGVGEGWIVADELDYTNPHVSAAIDDARRWIANETGRTEDVVEKADTALVGLAAQLLDAERVDDVVLLTTDKRRECCRDTAISARI